MNRGFKAVCAIENHKIIECPLLINSLIDYKLIKKKISITVTSINLMIILKNGMYNDYLIIQLLLQS